MTQEIIFHVYSKNLIGGNTYLHTHAFFGDGFYTIGSMPSHDMCLTPVDGKPNRYAVIEKIGGVFYVNDMGSVDGTILNGKRVAKEPLRDKDWLCFQGGEYSIQVVLPTIQKTPPVENKPLSKRVRIAVAMSDDGTFWSARGFSEGRRSVTAEDCYMRESSDSDMDEEQISTYHTHMVEVDIPLPSGTPLQAKIVEPT